MKYINTQDKTMKKFIIGLIGVMFASVMALSLSSCGKEDGSEYYEDNPFAGVWKEGSNRTEFRKNGTWETRYNYYSDDNDDYVMKWTETGTYTYDEGSRTLCKVYDKNGNAYMRIVQHISRDKIVYFDPTDMYTWTLIRME